MAGSSGAGSGSLPPSAQPGAGQGSTPTGGMGITSQGFGQEGYQLDTSDIGAQPKPPPEAQNFAVGVPYYLPFATPYRDSWEIFRDDEISIRQLVTMRRMDGQARALYRLVTMPILAALKNADVIPVDGQTGGKKEAQFIKDMLFSPPSMGGMTHTFTRFVKQLLLATFDGFTAFEMVYWVAPAGPNKGKITLRKIDWRPSETLTFLVDGQGEFNGFRQRCLTADTLVSQLDGTEVRIDEMVRRHQAGQEQWVYSCTEGGKVRPGKVADAKKVSDSEPLVEVTLDNGERVRCTYTHPWMLKDGTYKRAANLRPGDSLMPLYRSYVRPSSTSKLTYEKVLHPGTGRVEWTHSLVSRSLGFSAGRGHVIHHDFAGKRHRNNDPRNLRRLSRPEHTSLHNEAAANGGIRAAHAAWDALGHEERSRQSSERAHKRWQEPDYRAGGPARLAAAKAGTDPAKWGNHSPVSFADIDQVARNIVAGGTRLTRQAVTDKLGCSQDVIYDRVRLEGFSSWLEYKRSLRNHKVADVRFVEPEAVYDIEVEDYHNFALTAGVFVHNTFFQGRTIDVKIQKDTALYWACNEAERPFYGVSMFESAFYHYDKKAKLYYIVHLAAQRAAVGMRIGTMPPNPHVNDKVNFIKGLADLGLAQYMVLPSSDWTVTNIKEEGSFDYLGLINHHNSQMSKSVLAAWFDDQQGTGGDTTLVDFGKQSDATFMMMLESLLEEMADVINHHLIPRFIDWNFGSSLYPEFKWGPLTAEQKAAVQDTFDKLAGAGQQANVTPEFMLELEQRMSEDLGFDIDYDKIKKQREEQQQELQDQFALQGGVPGGPPPPGGGPPGQGAPPGGPPGAGAPVPGGAGSSAGGNAGTKPGGPNQQQVGFSLEEEFDMDAVRLAAEELVESLFAGAAS